MANYGLNSTIKHLGSGSFYTPFGTGPNKALLLYPVGNFDLGVPANQDFVISFWAYIDGSMGGADGTFYPMFQYGSPIESNLYYSPTNVTTPGVYSINSNGSGWEFGVYMAGSGLGPMPYVAYEGQAHTVLFTGSNGQAIDITVGWNYYELKRVNGTMTFTFNNQNTAGNFNATLNSYDVETYAGQIGTFYAGTNQPAIIGSTHPKQTGTGTAQGIYFDELFFARGISHVTNYKNDGQQAVAGSFGPFVAGYPGTIDDGALSTTVFLYHFNGTIADDYSPPNTVNSYNYSQLTAFAQKVRLTTANLATTSTLSATALRTKVAQAQLVSTSTLVTNDFRVEHSQAQLNSQAILQASIKAVRYAQSNLSAQTTQVSNASAIKSAQINIQALASELVLGIKSKSTAVALSSQATISIQATKYIGVIQTLQSTSSATTTAQKTARAQSSLQVQSTLTETIQDLRGDGAALQVQSSISIIAESLRAKQANVELSSQSTLQATGQSYVLVQGSSTLISQSTLQATPVRFLLDPITTWVIESEPLEWTITDDSRGWMIEYEERTQQV